MILYIEYFDSLREIWLGNRNGFEVYLVDHSRIQSLYGELLEASEISNDGCKRKCKTILFIFKLLKSISISQFPNRFQSQDEFDVDDCSHNKSYKIYDSIDKKCINSKEKFNTTDKDIMVMI